MNLARILAIALRIIRQFRRDRRSLALIILVPVLVLALLGYLFRSQDSRMTRIGYSCLDKTSLPAAPGAYGASGGSGGTGSSGSPDAVQTLSDILFRTLSENLPEKTALVQTDNPRADLESGRIDVALVVGADFARSMLSGTKPDMKVVVEGSNPGEAKGLSQLSLILLSRLAADTVLPVRAAVGSGWNGPPATSAPARTSGKAMPAPEIEYLYGSPDADLLDATAPALIGFFTFFFVFLLTCVSFLRERSSGTLERLAVSPATASDITFGYMTGFGFFALIQAALTTAFTVFVLGVRSAGPVGLAFVITFETAIVAVNLGIFCSAFAMNELQAIQFIPIVIVPQALLCGLILPVDSMPAWLAAIARTLPMTRSVDAMTDVMSRGKGIGEIASGLAVIGIWAAGALAAASLTLKLRES